MQLKQQEQRVNTVTFKNRSQADFFRQLRKRVDAYFQENNLSKTGGKKLLSKTILVFAFYFVPYFIIISGILPLWAMFIGTIVMGFGVASIGFNVMHDANHGSLSKKSKVNKWMGYTLNLIGGNAFLWKIQHNLLHHTYTNIHEMDEDLNAGYLIRLSKNAPRHKIHRYQHIYGLPLYGLLTVSWITTGDLKRLFRYQKQGMIKRTGSTFKKELAIMIFSKVLYFSYMLLIPYLLLDISFIYILIGFFAMHLTAGMVLSVVFQLAHIVEETEHPLANEVGNVENEWAIHQLMTTANFAPDNKVLNWYVGGLNYQVEHHLFSRISHIHYPAISKIVKQTAEEYGVPYYQQPTFFKAFVSHFKMLRQLGREEGEKVQSKAA